MPYRIAGIDVHKRVLAVAVVDQTPIVRPVFTSQVFFG